MYSIKNNIDNTIIIKKSKFITKLYKINDLNDINNIICDLKLEYNDATHICYAYIFNGIERCSDDGEPSGTAGVPILNVLKHNNLNCILAVIIRYFGGTKLGAGGLVRAYSNSVTDTLKLANIVELVEGLNIAITFNYDIIKFIDNLLNNIEIVDKKYDNNITYIINVCKDEYEHIRDILNDKCIKININNKIYMAKSI